MLINLTDRHLIAEKLRDGVLSSKIRMLFGSIFRFNRAASHWDYKVSEYDLNRPRIYWHMPYMLNRTNDVMGGRDVLEYIFQEHLAHRRGVKALSIGFGSGENEIRLVRMGLDAGVFAEVIGIDISQSSADVATQNARDAGVENICNFKAMSLEEAIRSFHDFDVIIAFSSLHHITNVADRIADMRGMLKDGGVLIAHEYVGANRHQYTNDKINLIKSIYKTLPEKYRTDYFTGKVKNYVAIPGSFLLWLYDPSEMIDSQNIEPALRRNFDIEDYVPQYGTIIFFVLKDIIHNFSEDDPHSIEILNALADMEMSMIRSGMLHSDFAIFVCRKTPIEAMIQ